MTGARTGNPSTKGFGRWSIVGRKLPVVLAGVGAVVVAIGMTRWAALWLGESDVARFAYASRSSEAAGSGDSASEMRKSETGGVTTGFERRDSEDRPGAALSPEALIDRLNSLQDRVNAAARVHLVAVFGPANAGVEVDRTGLVRVDVSLFSRLGEDEAAALLARAAALYMEKLEAAPVMTVRGTGIDRALKLREVERVDERTGWLVAALGYGTYVQESLWVRMADRYPGVFAASGGSERGLRAAAFARGFESYQSEKGNGPPSSGRDASEATEQRN
ncbi:MAG: hypothetical protein FLDDKLPJ_03319 [Phycisphaerae bacterium]|nr:hypothetical protein [Phycisphaerae bacterium]